MKEVIKLEELVLSEEEQRIYEVIRKLVEEGGNRRRAALQLGCSPRTIKRYVAGYKSVGKAYFVHGNRGRKPGHSLPDETVAQVVSLFREKYYDATFEHFTSLLAEREGICLSKSTVRRILIAASILSPLATKKTRKRYRAQQKKANAPGGVKRTVNRPEKVAVRASHPRRPRVANFGEMIQMDASLHPWFGNQKATLHLAVDDATGHIVGAWFDEQETLNGYYHVLAQILNDYGIPLMFYTDRRTVFVYRESGSTDTANDYSTQFGYACKELGIEIKSTSVPQAKGRIERLLFTMQLRLPVVLRLEGVTTTEQANDFLPRFVTAYNTEFALPLKSIPSVFEKQPSPERIDRILAVISERTVDPGHAVRFENTYYRTLNRRGMHIRLVSGTKGLVIRSFSGGLFFSAGDEVFALEEIPSHERVSRNFGPPVTPEPLKPRYIPPMSHPWKRESFLAFQRQQAQRQR